VIAATIGEFEDPGALVRAIRRMRELRYTRLDTYTPHAMPEIDAALGIPRTRLRWWVLAAGLGGVGLAYLAQWWCNAFDYPYLVGGRPYNSIPTDVPIMFETGVLLAGTTAFVAMLLSSRMPRLWSPVLDVPGYERTCVDRCWLVVHHPDPAWTEDLPRQLSELGAVAVRTVGQVPS
jgi:hypothetical protein